MPLNIVSKPSLSLFTVQKLSSPFHLSSFYFPNGEIIPFRNSNSWQALGVQKWGSLLQEIALKVSIGQEDYSSPGFFRRYSYLSKYSNDHSNSNTISCARCHLKTLKTLNNFLNRTRGSGCFALQKTANVKVLKILAFFLKWKVTPGFNSVNRLWQSLISEPE